MRVMQRGSQLPAPHSPPLSLNIIRILPKGGGTWPCVYKASYDLKKILALFTVALAFVLYAKQARKRKKRNVKNEKLWQIISAMEYENIYSYIAASGGQPAVAASRQQQPVGSAAHCWPNLIISKVERAAL